MDVFESLELRWFLPSDGEAVAAARHWFAATEPEGQRLDEYLLTGRSDLGFKIRGQQGTRTKVETKYQLGSLGVATVAPGMTGKLERWRKLSLIVDDAELMKSGSWIAVHKLRRVQQFAYDGKTASRVPRGMRVGAGCGLELTELSYRLGDEQRSQTCTTIGLEAFGPDDLRRAALLCTAGAAAGAGLELALGEERSMSYPEWLRSLGNAC